MDNQDNAAVAFRPPAEIQSNLIDLRKVFAVVRRRQWWALATAVIALALSIGAYMLAKPSYTATARVALDRRVEDLVATGQNAPALATDSSSVDTEVQVLTSPRVAEAVVDQLGLDKRPGFVGQPKNGKLSQAEIHDRAIDKVRNRLVVRREGTSYAIRVSYSAGNPALATAIVNTAIEQYVNGQRGDKVAERTRETTLLAEKLEVLRGEVQLAEEAVARYRGATNLITVQKDSTAVQQEISLLNAQLATARAEQAAAAARVAAGQSNNGAALGLESQVLRGLRAQEAELSAQRADLLGRYGERHPSLEKLNRQYADVQDSIRQEVDRIRAGNTAELRVAQGRAASIESSLGRARGALGAANSASVELNELERNAESARVLYQALLDRYRQSVTGQGTERSNAYIIAKAIEPRSPDSPDLKLYLLGGIVAGILGAAAVIVILELLESGFHTRADVESKLGLHVLASVADLTVMPGVTVSRRNPMAPADYLLGCEGSHFGESFRSIRAGLGLGRETPKYRTIAVSSALPNEGKTTTSVCLARSAALAGMRTLLIDCDLRRRASSRSMADDTKAGLIEVLKGEVSPQAAMVRDEASGAWLLPQRKSASLDYDIIASQSMRDLVVALSQSFDLVVLDTAPVLALAEARAVAAMADGVLLVVQWRKTPAHAAQLAVDQLLRAGANIAGAVLAQVNLQQQARAGSGDEMVYYNRFKSYYKV